MSAGSGELGTLSLTALCQAARQASVTLAEAPGDARTAALEAFADALQERADELIAADAERSAGSGNGIAPLTSERVEAAATACREIATQPDPVGDVLERRPLGDALVLERRRVPLGVVAWVFDARPHAVPAAIALCLRSGNSIVLHGNAGPQRADALLAGMARDALAAAGLPRDAAVLVPRPDGESLRELVTLDRLVDLVKQRGGSSLEPELGAIATVPILYAIGSNCHLYLHADAGADLAVAIAIESKVAKPGRCDAAEKLLVHAEAAERLLPPVLEALAARGVELRCDERSTEVARAAGIAVEAASEEDWGRPFNALTIAVRVVDSLEDAVEHVNRWGSRHSEAIVTSSPRTGERFAAAVDAAIAHVNAPTLLATGFDLGLGPDLGNSTGKLGPRGPIVATDLCTHRWVVRPF